MIDLKPDYQKWWNKKDLNENELSWLIFGVNPELMERFNYLQGSKANRTPEENKFIDDVSNEIEKTIYKAPCNIIAMREEALSKQYWQNSKNNFVKNIYENVETKILRTEPNSFLYAHPDFWAFLESIKERPTHLDIQRDIEQLKLNLSEWQNAEIKDENTAIAILLGYEPKWFIKRFVDAQKKKNSSDFSVEEKILSKTFYRYDELINHKFKKLKDLNLWQNDFSQFAKAVYNNGFIFNANVQELLKLKNINLKYEQNSWVYQLYKKWVDKKVWHFQDAACLFVGRDPDTGTLLIYDGRQSNYSLSPTPKSSKDERFRYYVKLYKNNDENEIDLYERMLLHTANNDLKRVLVLGQENEPNFNYIEITKWLIEQTGGEPPPILSEMPGFARPESLKDDKLKLVKTTKPYDTNQKRQNVIEEAKELKKKGRTNEREIIEEIRKKLEPEYNRGLSDKQIRADLRQAKPQLNFTKNKKGRPKKN